MLWAAVGKDPGFTPEGLIAEIRRNARYRADDYTGLAMTAPVDAALVSQRLRAALEAAEGFARAMPADKAGLLFLRDGRPVQPDPGDLSACTEHAGQRGGHWPSSPEISSAMLRGDEESPAGR